MNTLTKLAAVAASSVLALGLTPAPANAHTPTMTQGSDKGGVAHGYTCDPGADGYCKQYHRYPVVEDRECDSHAAATVYILRDGTKGRAIDQDGCGGSEWGTNWHTHPDGPKNVDQFKVCEASSIEQAKDYNWLGCTGWHEIQDHETVPT